MEKKDSGRLSNLGKTRPNKRERENPQVPIIYEEIGLFPRSFSRVLDRFFKQVFSDVQNSVVQEYRFYRILFLTTIKTLIIIIFLPFFINFLAKNWIVKPLAEYYWNGPNSEIFLNYYQQTKAFEELHDFEETLYFDSLVKVIDTSDTIHSKSTSGVFLGGPLIRLNREPSAESSFLVLPTRSDGLGETANHTAGLNKEGDLSFLGSSFSLRFLEESKNDTQKLPPLDEIGGYNSQKELRNNLVKDEKLLQISSYSGWNAPSYRRYARNNPLLFPLLRNPLPLLRNPLPLPFGEGEGEGVASLGVTGTLMDITHSEVKGLETYLKRQDTHQGDDGVRNSNFRHTHSSHETEQKLQEKTLQLAIKYNTESIQAITNIFSDLLSYLTLLYLVISLRIQINITKSFLLEVFFGLEDSKKCLLILLTTDLLVGYHSSGSWEIVLESFFTHYGLIANKSTILLLVATLPVLLDVLFKYLIFRHLNRSSPTTVATYNALIE